MPAFSSRGSGAVESRASAVQVFPPSVLLTKLAPERAKRCFVPLPTSCVKLLGPLVEFTGFQLMPSSLVMSWLLAKAKKRLP